jgi:excinuclease UvrABC ATPase subunit
MKNWMITLKSVCDACAGVPDTHKKIGKINVLIKCEECHGLKYVEKAITLLSFTNIINTIQDGYSLLDITNIINNIKDGY